MLYSELSKVLKNNWIKRFAITLVLFQIIPIFMIKIFTYLSEFENMF